MSRLILSIFFADHSEAGLGAAAISKMERFAIIVNGFQPLTIITKRSILDVAATLDPPLSLPQLSTVDMIFGERGTITL